MSVALDLRPAANDQAHPNDPGARQIGPPSSIEAEQALVGAVLYDNEAIHLCEGIEGRHFYEPFHGRLWDWMAERIGKGTLADMIVAEEHFLRDPAYVELGGMVYLAQLVEPAIPANAPHHARHVRELATRRDLLKVAAELFNNATEAVSVEDAIGAAEAGLLAMQASTRKLEPVTAAFAAARVLEALDNPAAAEVGISTGIEALDRELGPQLPGNLILGAGRPGMGKSAGAGCIALNIAQAGYGVIEINGEMSAEEMVQRHLSDVCHKLYGHRAPKYSDIRKRAVEHDQRQMLGRAQEILQPLPLVMLKRAGLKLSQLRSIARRQAAEWARRDIKLGMLIVDHMGLVKPDGPMRDRYEAQTQISNATKELAEELGCPVFALNQLNRETEKRDDKRPMLSDLRDSGAWEQDADCVIGWYREAYYAQRQAEPKGGAPGSKEDLAWAEWDRARRSSIIEAIILKARHGPPCTVKLWGDVARNAIRSSAPEGELF